MEYLEARWACTVVNSSTDIFDLSDPQTTLREAVFSAPLGDIITFSASLNGKTILLDRGLGEMAIDKNLTINASALPLGVTIDANDPTPTAKTGDGIRIFNITAGSVTMKNLTLKGADVRDNGGAISAVGDVYLTLDTMTVRDNGAAHPTNPISYSGGGLYFVTPETEHLPTGSVPPRLTIRDTVFQNNFAGNGGGALIDLGSRLNGIHQQALGQRVEILRSQFLGNTASDRGGAIAAWQGAGAELTLAESTVSGNVAGTQQLNGFPTGELHDAGGGIYSYLFSGDNEAFDFPTEDTDTDNGIAKLVITGSTIDNNIAGTYGGGVAICAKRQDPNLAT
jgi:hypothetical protein